MIRVGLPLKVTIATWIKTVVTQAYSLEGKTLQKGIRSHVICRQSCWQSSLTFAKHYRWDFPQSVCEHNADSVLRAELSYMVVYYMCIVPTTKIEK